MGEHLTEYVQLTRDVAYYLEHMEVLFLQEARHRSEPTLFVFLSCIIDEGECDHLVYGSIKFVYLGWQTAGRHGFKWKAGN